MFEDIKERILEFLKSRLLIVLVLFLALFLVLLQRIFSLQIVNGEEYQKDFKLQIRKERTISGTRGRIFDCKGNLLAYNELAYSVKIEDNGSYDTLSEKNKQLNATLFRLIQIIESKGDAVINDFNLGLNAAGTLEINISGEAKKRFLANVYGTTTKKLTDKQLNSSADDIYKFLCSEKKYGIGQEYPVDMVLKILRIRMAMSQNNYQKYISTTVAEEVNEQTVAVIMENNEQLQGVTVEETTMRKYNESKYMSPILGYTGKVSPEELTELQKKDAHYEANDIVGKAGIEQYMETSLQGDKGSETIYVDNVGQVVEVADTVPSKVGNDVYLSIDIDLQKAVYNILEQKLAGILVTKIRNIKSYTPTVNSKADDIIIPIDNVYFSLINNNVISTSMMERADAGEYEQSVLSALTENKEDDLARGMQELDSSRPSVYEKLNDEMKDYMDYFLDTLMNDGVLQRGMIDTSNQVYKDWKNEKISLRDFLMEAIAQNWLDVSKVSEAGKYTNSDETFHAIIQYLQERLNNDTGFNKLVCKYMIKNNQISGKQLCMILYEQGVLAYDENAVNSLRSGSVNAYDFILDKISNLQITPAQLALDPCSGSCTITNTKTGEVLAMVTYPGYDNNRLANSVDSDYYSCMLNDLSKPLYNRATQEKNAPGSTFKMVSSVAGLSEGVISVGETIRDEVEFKRITPSPHCWSSSGHGSINVSQAIEHSCNYFFYEVGYRLSLSGGNYDADTGLAKLNKYATMFGLNEKSGVEIAESEPRISDEYPVPSAIGQGTNNYACVQLARYVTAVANSGTCYKLSLLDKETDSKGNLIKDFTPEVRNEITISNTIWNAVHAGMRAVAAKTDCLKNLGVTVAGKTGTAQENKLRPNHALFLGYAPYDNPEMALCVKIANGYTSANSASVASDIFKYYFKLADENQLINGVAAAPNAATIVD